MAQLLSINVQQFRMLGNYYKNLFNKSAMIQITDRGPFSIYSIHVT